MRLEIIREKINKFIPYNSRYLKDFKIRNSKIHSYKIENVDNDIFYIELMLDNLNTYLILQNIWYISTKRMILLPSILDDIDDGDRKAIQVVLSSILRISNMESNSMIFFTSDIEYMKDLEERKAEYIWEHGIPVTPYMNLMGFLGTITRYLFLENILKSDDIILEAASGFGYGAAYISKLVKTVYAVDIDEKAVSFSKKAYPFSNIHWIVGDVTRLPFEDAKFDIYISFETLEHLPLDIVEEYLSEAKRVLKSGGKFVISTPNRETRRNIKNPYHIKEYDSEELKSLLKRYFSDIRVFSILPDLNIEEGERENAKNFIAICRG